MKVFLITAPLGRPEPAVYPLGLAYAATALAGHDVAGYDCNLPGRDLAGGLRRAADFRADVVAFSFRNIDTTQERDLYCYYPHFRDAVASARAALPGTLLVAGGAGFTLAPAQIMREVPALDVGVVGEAERTLPAALACGVRFAKVPGLYYRDDGRAVFSGPPAAADFEPSLPPDRKVFALADYAREPFAVGVQTQRGCPYRCAYCTYPSLEGGRVRSRTAASVGDELETLAATGVGTFTFVDAVWGVPAARAKDICRELIRRRLGMKWKAYFAERYFDGEMADLALEAGAAEFTFSPDAANDAVLAALGKDVAAEDLYRTLALVRERPRAVVSYSFFINPPAQNVRSFGDVVRFYLRGKRMLGKRFLGASFGNIRLEPGTAVLARAVAEGRVSPAANMLPRTRRELAPLFYHNRPSLRALSRFYVAAWRLKRLVGRALGRR